LSGFEAKGLELCQIALVHLEGEDVKRSVGFILGFWLLEAPFLWAAGDYYVGGIAAVATLSADGRSVVSQTTSELLNGVGLGEEPGGTLSCEARLDIHIA
jgi:hypothetical protein